METSKDVVDKIHSIIEQDISKKVIHTKPYRSYTVPHARAIDHAAMAEAARQHVINNIDAYIGLPNTPQNLEQIRNTVEATLGGNDLLGGHAVPTTGNPPPTIGRWTTHTGSVGSDLDLEGNTVTIHRDGQTIRVPLRDMQMSYDENGGAILQITNPLLRDQLNGNADIDPNRRPTDRTAEMIDPTTITDRVNQICREVALYRARNQLNMFNNPEHIPGNVLMSILPAVVLYLPDVILIQSLTVDTLSNARVVPLIYNGFTYRFRTNGTIFCLEYPVEEQHIRDILFHILDLSSDRRHRLIYELTESYNRQQELIDGTNRALEQDNHSVQFANLSTIHFSGGRAMRELDRLSSLADLYPGIIVDEPDPDDFQQ
jgi:hypothetical protein